MSNTTTATTEKKARYATLHTVFDSVKAIHEMTSTRLNGGVYRDEFGNVINDDQLFDVINERAFLALEDVQDLKMQIEELAVFHDYKHEVMQ